MGKIADRYAHKTNPLYPRAKEVVQAAIRLEAAASGDGDCPEFDDLADKVEDAVKTLNAPQFEMLLDLIVEQVEPRRDAEAICAEVFGLIESTCQHSYTDPVTGTVPGHLIAIPVALGSNARAWDKVLPVDVSQGIAAVLKKYDLLVDDSALTFMPRILSTSEAECLSHIDVFNIMTALSRKQPVEAVQALDAAHARVGYGRQPSPVPPADAEALSFGLMVAFFETNDVEPFPLLSSFTSALDAYEQDETDSELEAELYAAREDVGALLDKVGVELAPLLDCTSAQVLSPALDWYAATLSSRLVERESVALVGITLLAEEFTQGDISSLVASFDSAQLETLEQGLVFYVHNRVTGKFLRELRWRPFADETLEDSFASLSLLLDNAGLMDSSPEQYYPHASLAGIAGKWQPLTRF